MRARNLKRSSAVCQPDRELERAQVDLSSTQEKNLLRASESSRLQEAKSNVQVTPPRDVDTRKTRHLRVWREMKRNVEGFHQGLKGTRMGPMWLDEDGLPQMLTMARISSGPPAPRCNLVLQAPPCAATAFASPTCSDRTLENGELQPEVELQRPRKSSRIANRSHGVMKDM
ncbi:hypothetical protein CYMTET_54208 [Cymbomonas tetramitiformis]|uniref:Uncharacterized protein n=1 Tax=Cymbomonas tetramitiformis TaxID=36881 RepID=A0AAE0BFB8_9CHLO|nr:hypothetical protein CYMTET_54208 [Cymbomonas tetramitiformis]